MQLCACFGPKSTPVDTPILRLSCGQQVPASEVQIRERCQNIDFAVVLGHSVQSGLLETKLLFDHTKWVLNFGPDVRLLQAEACGYGRLY